MKKQLFLKASENGARGGDAKPLNDKKANENKYLQKPYKALFKKPNTNHRAAPKRPLTSPISPPGFWAEQEKT